MKLTLPEVSLAESSSTTSSRKIGNPRLAKRICESGLPGHLKHTAVVLALFWAREDGRGLYPSREYLAFLTGKSASQLTRDFTALVRLGVLVAVTPRSGGSGRSTLYRLNADALPARPRWTPKPRHGCVALPAQNVSVDADVNVSVDAEVSAPKRQHQTPKTSASCAANVSVDADRSVQGKVQVQRTTGADAPAFTAAPKNQNQNQNENHTSAAPDLRATRKVDTTPADCWNVMTQRFGPEPPKAPELRPFRVYTAIARDAIDQAEAAGDGSDGEVAELVKQTCATQGHPYTGHIVWQAIAAARAARTAQPQLRALRQQLAQPPRNGHRRHGLERFSTRAPTQSAASASMTPAEAPEHETGSANVHGRGGLPMRAEQDARPL